MQYGGEMILKNSDGTRYRPYQVTTVCQHSFLQFLQFFQDSKQNRGKQVFGAPLVIFGVWDFFGFLWFIAEVIVLARTRSSL